MSNKIYNIAIIDDEKEILENIKEFLTRNENYKVTTYSNPLVAVNSYEKDKFDLILCDINMPQMYGLDVLKEIIKLNPNQNICMMTAFSTLEKVLQAHKIGAVNYVIKPISLSELGKKVETILS